MKNFKNILHYLLTLASLLGFLGGWATLAHSRKPAQTVSAQTQVVEPLAPLDPIPDLGITTNANDNGNGLNIIVPPNNTGNQSSLNNSTNSNNSGSQGIPSTSSRLSRRSRSIFTTSGS